MLRNFLAAFEFLTIIPITRSTYTEKELVNSIYFYPLIGLLIGLFLYGVFALCKTVFPLPIVAILVLVASAYVTGALHIDGVGDSFDAFYAGKTKEDILRIMKDVYYGTMGTTAILLVLLTKFVMFQHLLAGKELFSLLLMGTLSRWSSVLAASFSPYAREHGAGTGKIFITACGFKTAFITTVFVLIVAFLTFQFKGLFVVGCIFLSTWLISAYSKSKIGGITGDVLGLNSEFNEIFTLLFILAAYKINFL